MHVTLPQIVGYTFAVFALADMAAFLTFALFAGGRRKEMSFKTLSRQEGEKYLRDWESSRFGECEPPVPGKYVYIEANGQHVAIDNTDGECWTESFGSLREAVDYLRAGK